MMKQLQRAGTLALLGALACVAAYGEILVDEHFPGYAEHSGWRYDWIRGVGDVSFDPNTPGFARYLLAGPGSESEYHNAELYDTDMPPYCDFEVRLRNSNNCGFDAPSWPPDPDPLHGMGSRGWGLWNRVLHPDDGPVNQIWFMSLSPESDALFRGRRVWIIRDSIPVVVQELEIDLTEWRTYRIKWRPDYIGVYVDDMSTPIVEVNDPNLIPSVPMTYTTWVDNNVVTGTSFDDMEQGCLPVPDINQYIDVDYIRVYTVKPGDLDEDGDVDLSDLAALLANFGVTSGATWADGDLDGDGDVDLSDLAALLAVFGDGCT